jgi:16S rRNA G966 N2-methylase RsmD
MADKIKGALYSMLSGLFNGVDREWGRVLDMYAGSGSIGIEALSRGADWADFVEVNAGVCRVISENLEHTKFTAQARVNNRAAAAFLNNPPGPPNLDKKGKRAAGGLHRRKGGQYRDKEQLEQEIIVESNSFQIPQNALYLDDSGQNGHNHGDDTWQYDIIFLDPPYADPKIPNTIEHVARSGLIKLGGLVVIGHSPRVVLAPSYTSGIITLNLLRHRRHGDSAFSIFIAGDPQAYGFTVDSTDTSEESIIDNSAATSEEPAEDTFEFEGDGE